MPTFFAKVFSRGKDKEKEKDGLKEPTTPKQRKRSSIQSLLEGKFEAVSPTVSPSVQKFEEREKVVGKQDKENGNGNGKEKEKEKDSRPALFRPKSRTASQPTTRRTSAGGSEVPPQLSLDLNLPSVRGEDATRRDFDLVVDGGMVLDDTELGARRLSAEDALKLMRACSSVILSRGLETLGVMHPHWHSASPAAQRKIISLFLSSLESAPSNATSPVSPTTSAASAFDLELEYTRSPHDVSAVFRWALRHLRLDGEVFPKDDSAGLDWYDAFSRAERERAYPEKAYSELLVPAAKPMNVDLLNTTLGLVSSLTSHSEMNGVFGTKLAMFLGHYLLTGNKVDEALDWQAFYSQWERAGRALEHIFLASLRDEASRFGIPKRLSELITNYPYSKSAAGDQFPRPPRFATRTYDALFIQIATDQAAGAKRAEESLTPARLIETALKAEFVEGVVDGNDAAAVWEEVKKASSAAPEDSSLDNPLARILSDDSIRLLSLVSDDSSRHSTPRVTMFTSIPEHEDLFPTKVANGNGAAPMSKKASGKAREEAVMAPSWSQFSSSGFGESVTPQNLASTLLDSDLEKTKPPALVTRRSLKRKSRSPTGRNERNVRPLPPVAPSTPEPRTYRVVHSAVVKLDEAFIDFWSDTLTDAGVTRAWPCFAVCQLRADAAPAFGSGDKKLGWIVVEARTAELRSSESEPTSPVHRASSPRPSERSEKDRPGVIGRVSATFGGRKRFNFFGGGTSTTQSPAASAAVTPAVEKSESKAVPKVGEMGEVIPEESATPPRVENDAATPVPATEASKKEIKAEAEPAEATPAAAAEPRSQPAKAALGDVTEAAEAAAIASAVEHMAQAETSEATPTGEAVGVPKEVAVENAVLEQEAPNGLAEVPPPAAGEAAAKPVVTRKPVPSEGPATVEVQPNAPPEEPTEAAAPTIANIPAAVNAEKEAAAEPPSQPVTIQTTFEREGVPSRPGDSRFIEQLETPPEDKLKPLDVGQHEELAPVVEEPSHAPAVAELHDVPAEPVVVEEAVEEPVKVEEELVHAAEEKVVEPVAVPEAEELPVAAEDGGIGAQVAESAAAETEAPAVAEEVQPAVLKEESTVAEPEAVAPEEAAIAEVAEQAAQHEEPVVEEPVLEEPAVEEPIVEEPVVKEAAVVEEHVAVEPPVAEALSPEHQAAVTEAADTTLLTDEVAAVADGMPAEQTAPVDSITAATAVFSTDELADAEAPIPTIVSTEQEPHATESTVSAEEAVLLPDESSTAMSEAQEGVTVPTEAKVGPDEPSAPIAENTAPEASPTTHMADPVEQQPEVPVPTGEAAEPPVTESTHTAEVQKIPADNQTASQEAAESSVVEPIGEADEPVAMDSLPEAEAAPSAVEETLRRPVAANEETAVPPEESIPAPAAESTPAPIEEVTPAPVEDVTPPPAEETVTSPAEATFTIAEENMATHTAEIASDPMAESPSAFAPTENNSAVKEASTPTEGGAPAKAAAQDELAAPIGEAETSTETHA